MLASRHTRQISSHRCFSKLLLLFLSLSALSSSSFYTIKNHYREREKKRNIESFMFKQSHDAYDGWWIHHWILDFGSFHFTPLKLTHSHYDSFYDDVLYIFKKETWFPKLLVHLFSIGEKIYKIHSRTICK